MQGWKMAVACAALLAVPAHAPAYADVKAGVDAWARGDYKTAVTEWRGPAQAGDADAQFNLGQAYRLGRGVPKDLGLAEQWFGRAAQQGHPQASDNYGLALFESGKRDQAVPWLEKSVARSEPRAQFVLGTMLFNGDVVTKDWVRAYALISRAAAAGLPQASTTLTQMERYVSLSDRQQGLALARRYEQQAARGGPVVLADNGQRGGGGSGGPVGTTTLPPSTAYVPDEPPPPAPRPTPAPTRIATRPPAPAPMPAPAPVRGGGGWQVQLGAFADAANARKLGGQVAGRFGGKQISYVRAGRLTKVLVGPFNSSAEASRACGGLKPCVPVQ